MITVNETHRSIPGDIRVIVGEVVVIVRLSRLRRTQIRGERFPFPCRRALGAPRELAEFADGLFQVRAINGFYDRLQQRDSVGVASLRAPQLGDMFFHQPIAGIGLVGV